MKPQGQAEVNFLMAIRGLFYFLPGRLPYKLWGFTLLAVFVYLLGQSNTTAALAFRSSLDHLKTFSPPILIQTIHSPPVKEVNEEEILESQGLIQTPNGVLPFSTKLRVFATSYDKSCPGCNEWTASGLQVGFGVVAVDPKVIPLGTKLFIPGYGVAVAGDTGGAIKGNKIDLGFDDVKHGWWSSRFVEIYILK
ncbi:MAG: hypothetical protein A2Z24_02270 [Candidatus Woykebacteria bacterium RBG_16_44_10]|uniref:3D domain-containing protein n=1 Tax=Candidatus Woykebacteria bacterium RBG_16_44_10 TaxID=1802597 RepID=A0A1G1WFY9_9BACT|nr:MAG: hypothetical protein A2Z24_02270 [Candidatus Woykebacteria bacterium RBG_16_44_10]